MRFSMLPATCSSNCKPGSGIGWSRRMSDFLINLACRGAGLPPNPAAISVAPAAMSPANAVAPDAMGADVVAYSEPVASNDDQSTQLPNTSQSVASPSAPSRWDGGSTVSNVDSLITPEPTPA